MMSSPERPRTIAWIESPFQLLSAIESASGGLLQAPIELHLRGPAPMYHSLLALLDRHPVAGLSVVESSSPARARRRLASASEIALGDLFSGQGGLLAAAAPGCPVVALDDGSSSLAALATVADPSGSLVRPRSSGDSVRSLVGRAMHRSMHRRVPDAVRLATGLPGAVFPRLPIAVSLHRFDWAKRVAPAVGLPDVAVAILGSSLSADGLIGSDHYLAWIERQCSDRWGSVIYLPHRRSDGAGAAVVRRHGGMVATSRGLPVEVIAGQLARSASVVTLPSTTVLTLPAIEPSIELTCWSVPDDWWLERATPTMRSLAAEICRWDSWRSSVGDQRTESSERRPVAELMRPAGRGLR